MLVLSLVAASIFTQVASSGSATALSVGAVDDAARSLDNSLVYAGGEWSIESSRLSPQSNEGITTLIVEVQVRNRLFESDYTMHRKSIWLVADWGEKIRLDRFANNESTTLLHLDPAETKSLTLAFKTSHTAFSFDDWKLEIAESEFHKPATLPLVGELNKGMIDLSFEESVIQSVFQPERVVVSSNHGSKRALVGRTFLHMEVLVGKNHDASQLENTERWKLSTNLETSQALQVSVNELEDFRSYYIVFDVDVGATTAELEIVSNSNILSRFNIVANKLG